MKKQTRAQFTQFQARLAEINQIGVEALHSKFTVELSVAQTVEEEIQRNAGFLQLINITPVDEQSGEVIGLGVGSTVAGTTDTAEKAREPSDPTYLTKNKYCCEQTNFDSLLTYKKLDAWSKFANFQLRVRNAIIRRQALDRIMIGFNGIERADNSERQKYKLLQDVNVGWLQKVRENAAERVFDHILDEQGQPLSDTIRIGVKGDFTHLDALVMDVVNSIIDEEYQDDTELVVICGRHLLADKYFPLVNQEQANSEKLAAEMIISQKRIGGLQAVRAPFFPANALFITRLDNLSIYWQEGSRRRHLKDKPERDRIENYESVNEAYVIEDYRGVALVENIEFISEQTAETQGDAELWP